MTARKRRRVDIAQRCPLSGKIRYPDRATAKRTAARYHPGEHMDEYLCGSPEGCGSWHIGHPPYRGRRPDAQCDVDDAPVYTSEAAAAHARIQAGPGWIVARCATHWHVVREPAA